MSLHKPTVFKGVATALLTPFRNGAIDYPALSTLIEMQIRAGVDALLIAGTTGEGSTISFAEFEELVGRAKELVQDRVPLLAGCGSNCTERACELSRIACHAGADALLAVTPYYNKTSNKGIVLHYQAIAAASTRPVLIYNVPSRTGFYMTLKHYEALAREERIVGVKEASGDLALLETLISEYGDYYDVYTGNDDQILPAMKLGARGVISVCSNIVPQKTAELCHLCASGDYKKAAHRAKKLRPLITELFREVNPIPVKYLASLMELCAPEYRLPLCPPASETKQRLEAILPDLLG